MFIEGILLKKNNRFVCDVKIENKIEPAFFPATGRIGNFILKDLPCLLTLTNNEKTKYTIEGISFNNGNDYIGINQNKANRYVEELLKSNQLSKIIKCKTITRERKMGNSKIDFVVNDDVLIEIKTPLIILPLKENYVTDVTQHTKNSNFVQTDRFFKHLEELSKHKKAIMIMFYMFEANPFIPPNKNETNKIFNKVVNAVNCGVEMWQVNCKFDINGVKLVDYYRVEKNLI